MDGRVRLRISWKNRQSPLNTGIFLPLGVMHLLSRIYYASFVNLRGDMRVISAMTTNSRGAAKAM